MCKKAVEGAYEGAQARGIERPKVIGVTVLTSLSDEDLKAQGLDITYDALVKKRTELAKEWGLDGVVCAASKAGELEKMGYDFIKITPGIKWAGKQGAGQKQLYTPDLAVRDCKNSILVIGSAMTKAGNVYDENDKKKLLQKGTAEDRRATAYEILQAMSKEL
jgi:orotidine-5'-phosphate decarboxylase